MGRSDGTPLRGLLQPDGDGSRAGPGGQGRQPAGAGQGRGDHQGARGQRRRRAQPAEEAGV